ncbi:MAG: hypothetical protein WC100_01445 [Sterolibacterium sp.]
MSGAEGEELWKEWIVTLPQCVQDFDAKHGFRPSDRLLLDDTLRYFVGYSEQPDGRVGLLVSPINPQLDYHGARAAREVICADHFEHDGWEKQNIKESL